MVEGPIMTAAPSTTPQPSQSETVKILCCMCGILIHPNPSHTCATCLASTSDVTRGISTEVTLHQCRGCQRWHKDEGKWLGCDLESRELMALCLSKVSGLRSKKNSAAGGGEGRIRLVDAAWIWTEPHSMRLKVRLTIQRQVHAGTILQQNLVVTYIVRNQQCIECQAEFRQGSWKSVVQVRQRVKHKRTFLYLEQLILKHGAHRGCLSIETFRDGMDFYFPDKAKAARFISFLENVVPVKIKTSKKLIGMDDKSNVANYKYTSYVELCPLCKDDLLYLPKPLATQLGNISRCCLVKHISNVIHLIDPLTGQTATMNPETYWRNPFRPIVTAGRGRWTRFVVLGREATLTHHHHQQQQQQQQQNTLAKSTTLVRKRNASHKSTTARQRSRVALVTAAREVDLGRNDAQVVQTSHIGYLLRAGDVCVGYDLRDVQFVNDEADEERTKGKLQDVVLVRKLYGGAAVSGAADNPTADEEGGGNGTEKQRMFALERLDVDVTEAMSGLSTKMTKKQQMQLERGEDVDEEDFLREVEADADMRRNMNLYRAPVKSKKSQSTKPADGKGEEEEEGTGSDSDAEDDQGVKLDELLDGLDLDTAPDSAKVTQEVAQELSLEEGERAAKDGLGYVGREEARQVQNKSGAVVKGEGFGEDFLGKNFKFT